MGKSYGKQIRCANIAKRASPVSEMLTGSLKAGVTNASRQVAAVVVGGKFSRDI